MIQFNICNKGKNKYSLSWLKWKTLSVISVEDCKEIKDKIKEAEDLSEVSSLRHRKTSSEDLSQDLFLSFQMVSGQCHSQFCRRRSEKQKRGRLYDSRVPELTWRLLHLCQVRVSQKHGDVSDWGKKTTAKAGPPHFSVICW